MSRVEQIGDAMLILADVREWLASVPPCFRVNAVVTSPLYNTLGRIPDEPTGLWRSRDFGAARFIKSLAANGYADDVDEATYQREQVDLFAALASHCEPDASLFYNHQLRWRDRECIHPIQWFRPSGWNLRQEIIWDRGGGMMFNARMFCRFDERILWFVRGDTWKWNQSHVGRGTIWRIARAQLKEHPVAFPVDLPLSCIGATTDPGDVVLDPYMGSATTGVAAIRLERKFIGVEREPAYFDIACRCIEAAVREPRLDLEPPRRPVQEAML